MLTDVDSNLGQSSKMSDAVSANERAASEPSCSDTINENTADSKSEVKVEDSLQGDGFQGDDGVKVKEEKVKVKTEPKDAKDGVPFKLKRKGRRGRSSGTLTMKGEKITSFTTERGVTYAPFGKSSSD